MLTVRIHLDHVPVAPADRIFIAKLQTASVTEIENMRYYRIAALFYHPDCVIGGRIVHNQYIYQLRDLRLCQLIHHFSYVFFFVVCRNNQ